MPSRVENESKLLTMYRTLEARGHALHFGSGNTEGQSDNSPDAMRKAFKDAEFHRIQKLTGEDPDPLMPEEQDKAIRELPRDRDVVELFKKLAGADPLPPR